MRTRPVILLSITGCAAAKSLACISSSAGPPIGAEYTSAPSTVMTKVYGVSFPSTPGVAFLDASDQPARQFILRVSRKNVVNNRTAHCSERQSVDVSVLAEFAADGMLGRSRAAPADRPRPWR